MLATRDEEHSLFIASVLRDSAFSEPWDRQKSTEKLQKSLKHTLLLHRW